MFKVRDSLEERHVGHGLVFPLPHHGDGEGRLHGWLVQAGEGGPCIGRLELSEPTLKACMNIYKQVLKYLILLLIGTCLSQLESFIYLSELNITTLFLF